MFYLRASLGPVGQKNPPRGGGVDVHLAAGLSLEARSTRGLAGDAVGVDRLFRPA